MAQVIEGGEFGVVFEGQEMGDLLKLVEFAIVTTENVGVPVWELGEWKTALEEALTKPSSDGEDEILEQKMEILPPEAPICKLCNHPQSKHRNDATGANVMMNLQWPRWRCPPDFKTGGEVAGGGQFGEEGIVVVVPPVVVGDNSTKKPMRGRRRDE